MQSQLLLKCQLHQYGPFAGTFCLDDGISLGRYITGVIKQVSTLFRYRLPITLTTPDEDGNGGQGQASLWSGAGGPEDDHYLREQLRCIYGCRPQEVEAIFESRKAYKRVQMELDDGRWMLLIVPPTSVQALEQWTERRMHLPVKISAQKLNVGYLMVFDAAEDPKEQDELRVLAAMTTSLKALKMLVKGQKRILRRANEAFSARSGLSDTEIKARTDKTTNRDGEDAQPLPNP